MTSGYDETLRDPSQNKYAGVGTDQASTSRSLPSMTANPTLSTKRAHFIPQTGELSSFYFNGPSTDPYNYHSAQQQQVQAQVAWWSDPIRSATLDHYSGLLSKYGHTNSPGTLWALAQSGLDTNAEAVQSMLKVDATAYNADYQQGLPSAAGSPQQQSTMQITPEEETPSSWWDVPQWATRNLFSAASMPLEAVQGAWRESGGIIADPEKSLMEKIGGVALTSAELVAPPVAGIANAVGGESFDTEHQNPWEQTEFGQQLISAGGGAGMDAFGSLTAGLDTEKAKGLLSSDPAYAEQRQAVVDNPSLMGGVLNEIAQTNNLRGGAGWFIDESSVIGEAQRQSTYNSWAIPGPNGAMAAWTLGRGIASVPNGPDWAGYNFVSGLIDAVASVAGDPTIWGGKLGLVSKSLRGVGRLVEKAGVEGAELALTVGKEAKKVTTAQAAISRNGQKLLTEYNKMNPENQIDLAEWAGMDLSDKISLVHQVERGKATQEAVSGSMPSFTSVVSRLRDMRRAASERWRGDRQGREGFVEADTLARQRELWGDYAANAADITSSTPKRVWNVVDETTSKYGDYTIATQGKGKWTVTDDAGTVTQYTAKTDAKKAAQLGQKNIDENAPPKTAFSLDKYNAWYDNLAPEDKALWDESEAYVMDLLDKGRLKIADPEENPEEYFRQVNSVIGSHLKGKSEKALNSTKKGKLQGNVESAAAMSIVDNSGNLAAQVLAKVDYAGVTFAEDIQPGVLQRTIVDGQDAMSGWIGDIPPVLMGPEDQVIPEIANRVLAQITDVLAHPDHKTVKPSIKKAERGSLADQVANQLREFENPIPDLTRKLSNPGLTYSALFRIFSKYGLEGYLDDFLRKESVDGIAGMAPNRKGAWMGDHPLVEHYKFPSNAHDNAITVAGISDEAARAAALKALPKTAVRTGLRGESIDGVSQWTVQAAGRHSAASARRVKENTTLIETARANEARLANDLTNVDEKFADPESALLSFLSYEAGITTDAAKGVNVDMNGLRWFLFGNGPTAHLRARVLSKMANMLSESDIKTLKKFKPGTKEYDDLAGSKVAELVQITRNKWDAETYNAVLRNAINGGGEDGLLLALGPRLGLNGVDRGSISRGVKLVEDDGMKTMQTWRTSNRLTKRWVNRAISERPGGRVISTDNTSDVVDALIKYGMYAKVPIKDLNAAIGRVVLADGKFGAVETNIDVLKNMFTKIGNVLSNRLAESNILFQGEAGSRRLTELQNAMRDSVNIFAGGHTGSKNDLANRLGTQGDMAGYIDEFGERVGIPRAVLDSELLNGEIHLPSVDEWQAGMGRLAAALHRFSPVEKTYDIARSVYDNFFRTSLLVFRGAYVIRNSAEMQMRMFLNGHHSIFNDPATLIGMTLGNFTKQGRESIFNDFAKYTDTILGEAWDAGPDKAIAYANKTEKYFALMREAHSLTDPRVYQTTIFKGWQTVNVNGSQFSAGWANELIMLNNSDIARVVLGNIPHDFTAQMGFQTVPDAAVAWMLSSRDDAARIRARMIAGDDKFSQIFASEAMTRDYLFDNPNSVMNRINKFTMDDASLKEFVKSGVLHGEGAPVHVKQLPELKERITAIRSVLNEKFYESGKPTAAVVDHMTAANVTVPWIDTQTLRKGSGFVDGFFRFANKIERIGSVGPEFRMAYWDRMAELLPGLRVEDIPRATEAAKTTLSKIQRMNPDGIAGNIGGKHPAWKALEKAKRENVSGLMTLDELHVIATDFAADHVKNLFYDAAKRNNFWTATRLIFPFGQAWGNTISEWTKLGAKRPAKVYEALKALNAAGEEGASTIYETGQTIGGAFGDYEEGLAPWDQDPNGGFFYSDQYGDTSFMLPYVGRAAAVPANILAKLNGYNANINSIDMSSNTQSMNLALGSESISPGTSFLVPMGLSLFPDSDIVDSLMNIAAPYGPRNVAESSLPSWASNFLGGIGSLPIVGNVVSDWVSPFSASVKNKNARDAVAILSATGQYDLADPISVRQMQDDANNLAPSLLLISGIFKNVMPVNPTQQLAIDTTSADSTAKAKGGAGTQAAFAIVNNLYQQMLEEAGGDTAVAKEELIRQFGAPFLFVVTGNKKGYSRIPSSDALQWARSSGANMATARAFPDYFSLFFPKGDPTDLTAKLWIEDQTNKSAESKTVEEVTDESISLMIRTQRARIDSLEVNGDISQEQADLWRSDIEATYEKTTPGQTFNSMTTADQLVQIDAMLVESPSLMDTPAGKAYGMAMRYRGDALEIARDRSGDPSTSLSGKKVAALKSAYLTDLEDLVGQYPEFRPMYNILSKEWD